MSKVIQEIKHKTLSFEVFTCLLVKHSSNQAAHTITVEGKRWLNQQVWIEEAPQSMEEIAKRDQRQALYDGNGSEENELQ